jgi:hypothetical protein
LRNVAVQVVIDGDRAAAAPLALICAAITKRLSIPFTISME